jgi:putative inorganic carbon (HCO3(-)) transporter
VRAVGKKAAMTPEQADVATRKYYYWLLVVFFFEYARPASFLPFLQIPFLYSAIPLSLLAVSSFAEGLRPFPDIFSDKLAKWPIVIIGLIIVSAVFADVTSYVWTTFTTVLGYVLLFVMMARIITTVERLRGVITMLLLSHLFLLAMNPSVVLDPKERHYILGASFLGDGNDFSLSLCLLLPLAIELAQSKTKTMMKLATWGGVALLLLAIIGTQSRGASLACGALFFFLWLYSPRKMVAIMGCVLVGIVVLIYAPPQYFNRMNTISNYQEDGSAQGRIEAWKSSINMAADHPLTGVGAGHFAVAFGTKYRTPGAANMPWLTAHSSYFLLLGELGLPGLLCLLAIIIGNIVANLRMRKAVLAKAGPKPTAATLESARLLFLSAGACVGLGVAGAFLSAAYYPHFYVLSGLLVATRYVVAKREGIDLAVAGKRLPARRARVGSAPAEPAPPPATAPTVTASNGRIRGPGSRG